MCETALGIVSPYVENDILWQVGGRNTVLLNAVEKKIPLLTDMPTIIFGADVTHPQPGEYSTFDSCCELSDLLLVCLMSDFCFYKKEFVTGGGINELARGNQVQGIGRCTTSQGRNYS